MYKLYYSPGACSMAPHVVLNELNVPFELVRTSIQEGQNKTQEFLAINPRGSVPVLDDDGAIIREGAAILIHLLEKHNSPMLPRSGKERDTALEWLAFANATMHPAYGRMFFLSKTVSDKNVQQELMKLTADYISKLWAEVDAKLANQPYICGKEISAADILFTVFANWNGLFSQPITMGNNVKKLLKSVSSRPSYQKALATEKVEYKAAA